MAFGFTSKKQLISEAVAEAVKVNNESSMELIANVLETWREAGRPYGAESGTYDGADTMHNIYSDYGYPLRLEFYHFWNMYRRFGIAGNVIEAPPAACWGTHPTIETSEAAMKELEMLVDKTKLWSRLKTLDERQRVGKFAGLFIRARDGKQPSEELAKGSLNGHASIMELIPLYESQLEIVSTEKDASLPNYGMPTMYKLKENVVGDRDPQTGDTMKIHPSRIIIAAEGAADNSIFGVPALEKPYNSLMDLRKVIGGAGEGFYKNAAQSVALELTDTAGAAGIKDLIEKFNEKFDDFMHNRMRRGIVTPGMKPSVLSSTMISPMDPFEVALFDVAAATGIPAAILVGKQTGRLASDQDSEQFLATMQSRRENFLTDLVKNVLEWFMNYGAMARAPFEIVWDDLLARSPDEKLANADKMADINAKQFQSGGEIPFSGAEIREEAGWDPEEMEPDLGGEELDEEAMA